MSSSKAYIALDAHARNCVLGWRNGRGEFQGFERFETSEKELVERVGRVPADTKIARVEESTLADWVASTLHPWVQQIIVCNPREDPSLYSPLQQGTCPHFFMLMLSRLHASSLRAAI